MALDLVVFPRALGRGTRAMLGVRIVPPEGLEPARVSKSFTNDVLLALSCREAGCVLVTENERDVATSACPVASQTSRSAGNPAPGRRMRLATASLQFDLLLV